MYKKVLVVVGILFGFALLVTADYVVVKRLALDNPLKIPQFFNKAQEALPPNSAHRMIWWVGDTTCANLTDAQLDLWKSRGIGGFVCQHAHLAGMGGSQDFTGNPDNPLTTPNYSLQKQFKDSNVVARANARGLKMYLGFPAVNYYNCATPFKEWFDDAGWSTVVIPKVHDIAAAAKLLGFAGLNIDQELYPQRCGQTASWNNRGTVPAGANVAAKVKERGQQMMRAMLDAYPGIEVMFYHNIMPQSWEALVQCEVNQNQYWCSQDFSGGLYIPFWDGMTSVEGYSAIRFQDAMFYKSPQRSASWDNALQYNDNRIFAYLSRTWSNWNYAAPRFSVSPFVWIDDDCLQEHAFSANKPINAVAAQLQAFNKWGMDGQFSNYTYSNNFKTKDYADYYSANCAQYVPGYDAGRPYNYLPAIKDAATPKVVDQEVPELAVTTPADRMSTTATSMDFAGTANDNMAIRYIKWENDRGGSGTAKMTWNILSGDYRTGYNARMDWQATGIPLAAGKNVITITAYDIKGLSTSKVITVNPDAAAGPTITPTPGFSSVQSPANPNATAATRAELAYLRNLPQGTTNRVVSGQQVVGTATTFNQIESLQNQTGQWVGLLGADFGYDLSDEKNSMLINYWNQGGLVTVSLHANNPQTGGRYNDTNITLRDVYTTGTVANQNWKNTLDDAASNLQKLEDAGVVVLFRPFHEMNKGWFWWGAQGTTTKADYIALWRYTYNYLTVTKGLNNLLWVYAPTDDPNAADWYPGTGYVDIVGVDHYDPALSSSFSLPGYQPLQALGKPFALTEFGPRKATYDYTTLIKSMKQNFPNTSYFMAWGNDYGMQNFAPSNKQLLEDPWVVNRGELTVRSTVPSISPPTPTPTRTPTQPPAANATSQLFGTHDLINDRVHSDQYKTMVATLKTNLHIQVSRNGLNWGYVEKQKGVYDWSKYDAMINELVAAGIKPLMTISGSPAWANGSTDPSVVPTDQAAFNAWLNNYKSFVSAAAARYKGKVQLWEVWNEEEGINFWKPIPNVRQYAALYTTLRQAIKAQDPSAQVAMGGVDAITKSRSPAISGRNFLTQLNAAGVYPDAIALHPYSGTGGPLDHRDGENNFDDIALIHSDLVARGHGNTPIWITEWGWSSQGLGPDKQALYIKQSLDIIKSKYTYVKVAIVFSSYDWPSIGATYGYDGLMDNSGNIKPAGTEFANFITSSQQSTTPTPTPTLRPQPPTPTPTLDQGTMCRLFGLFCPPTPTITPTVTSSPTPVGPTATPTPTPIPPTIIVTPAPTVTITPPTPTPAPTVVTTIGQVVGDAISTIGNTFLSVWNIFFPQPLNQNPHMNNTESFYPTNVATRAGWTYVRIPAGSYGGVTVLTMPQPLQSFLSGSTSCYGYKLSSAPSSSTDFTDTIDKLRVGINVGLAPSTSQTQLVVSLTKSYNLDLYFLCDFEMRGLAPSGAQQPFVSGTNAIYPQSVVTTTGWMPVRIPANETGTIAKVPLPAALKTFLSGTANCYAYKVGPTPASATDYSSTMNNIGGISVEAAVVPSTSYATLAVSASTDVTVDLNYLCNYVILGTPLNTIAKHPHLDNTSASSLTNIMTTTGWTSVRVPGGSYGGITSLPLPKNMRSYLSGTSSCYAYKVGAAPASAIDYSSTMNNLGGISVESAVVPSTNRANLVVSSAGSASVDLNYLCNFSIYGTP